MTTAAHGTLGLGAAGASVGRIQSALAELGFRILPEEKQAMLFGRSTERVVQEFQRERRLNATGIVDGATVSELTVAAANGADAGGAASDQEAPAAGSEVSEAPSPGHDVPSIADVPAASLANRAGEHVLASERLVRVMRAHGVAYPEVVLRQCRQTGLPLHYACALLDKESGGGRNVFGHDPVKPSQIVGGRVTLLRYLRYKRLRRLGYGAQGVGPCQLTWPGFQDRADAVGGCHSPAANMRVGFSILRALIRTYGVEAGAARYHGRGPASVEYGRDFAERANRWRLVLTT